jgi:cytochrome c553
MFGGQAADTGAGVERKMVQTEARRRSPAALPARYIGRMPIAGLALAALTLAACSAPGAKGADADSTVAGTVHVCSSCHGPEGRSISSTFPRLAGQQKDYIVAQLTAFRDKTRADPHAKTYMWGMAARLSDPTIEAIAAYYAAQPPVAGELASSPEITAGKKIFTDGIPSESVPPCMSCHGEKAAGNGPIPRLAGQHPAYLARQLEAFASNARANAIMHANSKNLRPEQISEVTAFLATQ